MSMIHWLLAVMALFVLQTFLPPWFRYLHRGGRFTALRIAAGPRDVQPPMPIIGERASRALANMGEAVPVFLSLAVLQLLAPGDTTIATRGAGIFFWARVAYVPAYLSGVPGLRSAIWVASWIGLVMMIISLRA